MKRFICWYAYRGMETEGSTQLEEPVIIEAVDMAEAMWKWHNKSKPGWGERFYGSLDNYRSKGEFTGWGCYCEELAAPKVEEKDIRINLPNDIQVTDSYFALVKQLEALGKNNEFDLNSIIIGANYVKDYVKDNNDIPVRYEPNWK